MDPQDFLLDHYHHPRHFGALEHATHHAEMKNFSCGDMLSLDIVVKNGILHSVGWTGNGCTISQASASLLCEKIEGMNLEDAKKIDKQYIFSLLSIPISPARTRCALLSLEALKIVLQDT